LSTFGREKNSQAGILFTYLQKSSLSPVEDISARESAILAIVFFIRVPASPHKTNPIQAVTPLIGYDRLRGRMMSPGRFFANRGVEHYWHHLSKGAKSCEKPAGAAADLLKKRPALLPPYTTGIVPIST
jgi:hypothetical protein